MIAQRQGVLALARLAAFAILVQYGCASEAPRSGVTIEGAWARPSPEGARSGAAYMTLTNHGDSQDRLIGAASEVSGGLEFHESVSEDGVMKMRRQEAIDLPPNQSVLLEPGGLHVMLIGLQAPLVEGSTFEVLLEFEASTPQTVIVRIESR